MRIVFDTWQFVRIMVRLEETRDADAARQSLWSAWSGDWQRVDAELEQLRAANFDRFAVAMMDEEVTFDPVDRPTVATVARLAREVAKELQAALKRAPAQDRDDLDFERASLMALASQLDDLAAAGS